MIRIDTLSENSDQVVLAVAGRVADSEVAFVEEEIGRWLAKTEQLVLDLKGVKFIDQNGLALLERYAGTRLQLRGGSLYIRDLLETHGLETS